VHYHARFNFAVLAESAHQRSERQETRFDYFQRRLPPLGERHRITEVTLLFAVQHQRLGHSDAKVRFLGRTWPMSASAGSQVTACWRPDEQVVMLWRDQRVGDDAL
jgi:hypothetical protein